MIHRLASQTSSLAPESAPDCRDKGQEEFVICVQAGACLHAMSVD